MNVHMSPVDDDAFAALMAPLGPWPAERRVAVAVSGGADSVCLAWLAARWGDPLALIVDHGLRAGSGAEAREAACRIAAFGVPARILTLNVPPGPGVAARAREARYAILTQAALEAGRCDLLLGHHAGDQAETVLIRRCGGSGVHGLAAMASVTETASLRLVRPLLAVPPGRLRATLRARSIGWSEDPSNRNPTAGRTHARLHLNDPDGAGPAIDRLLREAHRHGRARVVEERRMAATLAARACLFPEGYALLSAGPIDAASLGALIRMLGGAPYPQAGVAVQSLLARGMRGTLGGVRLMAAGRQGAGTLLVREEAAMQPAIPARHGCVWDGRFRLEAPYPLPADATLGPLGPDARRFRRSSRLASAILASLPALRDAHGLVAVPHLGYFKEWTNTQLRLRLCPASPATGAGFMASALGDAQAAREHHVLDDAAAHPG
jgi:tRNA(Ile)-lysidine synthase